jgi:hypothetical protein
MLTVRGASQQSWMTDVRFGSKADIEVRMMSALPLKADIAECAWHVRFVPKADITRKSARALVTLSQP